MATPGVVTGVPAATCTAIGGTPLPGGLCIVNKNATTLADLTQKFGKLGDVQRAPTATTSTSRRHAVEEHRRRQRRRRALVSRRTCRCMSDPVQVLPAPLVKPRARRRSRRRRCRRTARRARSATRGTGSSTRSTSFPKTRAVRHRDAAGRAHVDAVGQGHPERSGVQGPRQLHRRSTRSSKNYFGLAVNFTPTWFQVLPGVDLLAPVTWSQGISGNAAVSFGGNENAGNWSAGVAADIYQKYRIDLKYTGYYGNYSTDADAARSACANGRPAHRCPTAAGCRSLSRPPSDEEYRHVSQIIDGARHRVARRRQRARGGFGRRGQAARHDAHRRRRREGRQQGRHDSRVHRRHQAAGRLSRPAAACGPTRSRARSRA